MIIKTALLLGLITVLNVITVFSQTIVGNLKVHANQKLNLEGFNGLKTYSISGTTIDSEGNFKLNYTSNDYGLGFLSIEGSKPFFVILSNENTEIIGEHINYLESITFKKGFENQAFDQYSKEFPKREQALSAWAYLEKLYKNDSLFFSQNKAQKAIFNEQNRIKKEDIQFLQNLPKESYVSWYLPTRKLISSVSIIAQLHPEEISATIQTYRKLDYCDSRLYKSGLLKDALESHFWLLENSGKPLDSIYVEMKVSIDSMLGNLVKDPKKLNEITDYLFDLLERHSLFEASEYLALKVLNEVSCTIDSDLAKQLETYRAMKKGNIAPDIEINGDIHSSSLRNNATPKKLSDIKNKFTLIVFGASWCPKCKEELPEIAKNYSKWISNDVEVIFVSLDDKENEYKQFVKDFPFLSVCDYKKWNSPIAQDYYVFGTPTMFLLDSKREILLRPNSVKQMDAWVDWFLIQGNK